MRYLIAALVLALAFVAGAASRTVIYNAPAAVTAAGGWQVCLMPDTNAFSVPTTLVAVTNVCAIGNDGISTDCTANEERTTTPPQEYIDFLNQRLAAWKTAKGY